MGNHHYAIQDFNRAIALDDSNPYSYFHLGISKLKSRLVREAIEDFNKANSLDENPAAHDGLGCCYHHLRDYDEAISYFNLAIGAKPDNVDFLRNRAQCYYDMEQY